MTDTKKYVANLKVQAVEDAVQILNSGNVNFSIATVDGKYASALKIVEVNPVTVAQREAYPHSTNTFGFVTAGSFSTHGLTRGQVYHYDDHLDMSDVCCAG